MEVTRGAIVVVAARGAYSSKPRPALIVQSNLFNQSHSSVTVCPITSDCVDAPLFRVSVPPGERTGLTVPSQVMVDKVVSVPRRAVIRKIGQCDQAYLDAVDDSLRGWLGL
jgi:mRNA interferase MazF